MKKNMMILKDYFVIGVILLIALPGMTGTTWATSANDGFDPGANSDVNCIAIQADGKILVGGGFTTIGGQARNYIARLNSDGSVDAGFYLGANSWVNSIAVQADGKILVGGGFTTIGGQARNCIARLNSDGSVDTGFNPGANSDVNCIAI